MKRLLLALIAVLILPLAALAEKPPVVTTTSTDSSMALARHLRSTGAVKYSAYWCPNCLYQSEILRKQAY